MMLNLRWLTVLGTTLMAVNAWGQEPAKGDFTSTALEAGWTLAGAAALTAPAQDPAGGGWLRLTGNANDAHGSALQTGGGFSAARGLTVALSYVSWGGGAPGADGISIFLYDAASGMAGAVGGGGLGYCKGAGGWLGLALDEFGNFSHPSDRCGGGGGPGTGPQTLALRGPAGSANLFIAHAPVPGKVDHSLAPSRPPAAQVLLYLSPKATGVGYSVTADWRADPSAKWTRLLRSVDFPFAAPPALRVGVAATTGGARNIHEVRQLSVRDYLPPAVRQSFEPPEIAPGATSTWVMHLSSTANAGATLLEPYTHRFPTGVRVANPVRLGGTCPGSVSAPSGAGGVIVERGTVVRTAGCTVTVDVTAGAPGRMISTVPAGSIVTDTGANLEPAAATLTVRAPAR